MKNLDQLIKTWKQENVSGWMGSWIERIGDYIKKTYSPPEVAIMILLSVLIIYLFSQILEDYLEERSRKKKVKQISKILEDYFEMRSRKKKVIQNDLEKLRESFIIKELHQEFQICAETFWLRNWLRAHKYLTWLSKELLGKLEANSLNSYTFFDVKNILFLIELLVGFRMDDSFEYELKHLQQVFHSKNWNYRYFLHCRHIHNVVQKELLENINPQLESDSTAEFKNKHLYLLVQIMFQFPPMWRDPWSPD